MVQKLFKGLQGFLKYF